MWFSGLRGAIAYAVSLHLDIADSDQRRTIITTSLCVVLFTILVLGGSTYPLVKWMKVSRFEILMCFTRQNSNDLFFMIFCTNKDQIKIFFIKLTKVGKIHVYMIYQNHASSWHKLLEKLNFEVLTGQSRSKKFKFRQLFRQRLRKAILQGS